TKSAFDSIGNRRTNLTLGGSYDDVYRLYLPKGNFSYAEIIGKNKTVGISFNASYSKHDNLSLGSTLAHVTTAPAPSPLVRAQIADYPNIRWRLSAGLKLDFKLDQATTAHVNFLYNGWREGIDAPSTYRYVVAQTAANGSNVLPGFTDDFAEWRPAATTFARILVGQSPKNTVTRQLGSGIKRQQGPWKLSGNLSYSWAKTRYDSLSHGVGVGTAAVTNVGLILDRRNRSRYFPAITQTSGADYTKLASHQFQNLSIDDREGRDEIVTIRADVERKVALAAPTRLQAGIKFNEQHRKRYDHRRNYTYNGPDGRPNSGDESVTRFTDGSYRQFDPGYPGYAVPEWFSIREVVKSLNDNPTWWQPLVDAGLRLRLADADLTPESISRRGLQSFIH
ncbi:MAG: hypothetical protein ACREH8_07885, partial [Opitutaceae bacterium]